MAMDSILKHMLDVTGHRDHQLLERSILTAIRQMTDAHTARVLGLEVSFGETVLRAHAWFMPGGELVVQDDSLPSHQTEEPITDYPVLMRCIETMASHLAEPLAHGACRLWFPIWVDGKVTSCFEIIRTGTFSRKKLDLLEGMLGVYRNFVGLLEYSETDSLTGLLNRKTFEKHFSRSNRSLPGLVEVGDVPNRRHEAEHPKQWLAVVDIDHFKRINDTFGHLYGDEVLILLAQLMRASFRAHDRIFRFGGEEFVILIYSATLENVMVAVERFRHNVEHHRFPQVGKVTVSLGFTEYSPAESPVEILGHADRALYYAKSHGRNQVRHYGALVEQGLLTQEIEQEVAPIEYF
jgi:diguanylate cyclase (GGDEF)-like protein